MRRNSAGESWSAFYESGDINWCDPDTVTWEYLKQWCRSEWIRQIVRHGGLARLKGAHVLEAGCGTGFFSVALASLGYAVEAFDCNVGALDYARRILAKVPSDAGLSVRFYQDDLLEMKKSNAYDLVFNQAVLEYFLDRKDRLSVIKQMSEAVRPGARIVLIVQHTGHPMRRLWMRWGWPGYCHQPAVAELTPEELSNEFREAGLTDIKVDGIEPWKMLFFWPRWYKTSRLASSFVYFAGRFLNRFVLLPSALRARMATQIVISGRKQ